MSSRIISRNLEQYFSYTITHSLLKGKSKYVNVKKEKNVYLNNHIDTISLLCTDRHDT